MVREARRSFRLNSLSLEELNFMLAQLGDRLDELEGRRGTPKFRSNVDMGLNRVTQMQSGSSATDGATVIQIDTVSTDLDTLGAATGGVQNLSASTTPGANRLVMSPTTSQYIDKEWLSTDLLKYYFESAEQTITSAGALTLAHGLGVLPKLIQVFIKCQTAEYNYSVGDQIPAPVFNSDGTMLGVSVVFDSTNLNIRFGNNAQNWNIPNKSTGALSAINNANWKAIFRAWA